RRKAYALLAAYIDTFRSAPDLSELQKKGMKGLGEHIKKLAANAFEGGTKSNLDEFLLDAIERAGQAVHSLEGPDTFEAISGLLVALRQRATKVRCSNCRQGSICCGNEEQDSEIVAAEEGGTCIQEIKAAFRLAQKITSLRYADSGLQAPDFIRTV